MYMHLFNVCHLFGMKIMNNELSINNSTILQQSFRCSSMDLPLFYKNSSTSTDLLLFSYRSSSILWQPSYYSHPQLIHNPATAHPQSYNRSWLFSNICIIIRKKLFYSHRITHPLFTITSPLFHNWYFTIVQQQTSTIFQHPTLFTTTLSLFSISFFTFFK